MGEIHLDFTVAVLEAECSPFFLETMDFQNNASANIGKLYFLHDFVILKCVASPIQRIVIILSRS